MLDESYLNLVLKLSAACNTLSSFFLNLKAFSSMRVKSKLKETVLMYYPSLSLYYITIKST